MAERKTEEALATGSITLLRELITHCSCFSHLRQIHAQLIIHDFVSVTPLIHFLIRSTAAAGHLRYASRLLELCRPASTVLWNILIQAYSKSPRFRESLCLFRRMLADDFLSPDKYTFTFAITSCTHEPSPDAGQAVHSLAAKAGVVLDLYVANSLVNFYSDFGRMDSAKKVFDEMPIRDGVSWSNLLKGFTKLGDMSIAQKLFDEMPHTNGISWVVMIAGYVSAGKHHDALKKFNDMLQCSNVRPNEAILVSVLSACSHIGAFRHGRWVHCYIDAIKLPITVNITNALIDMYSKCGNIAAAREVFTRASVRDLLTWSSMISGLALHGQGEEALEVFHQMVTHGVKPDNIAILGVLNACSHSGLVDEGCLIFYKMSQLWGIAPEIEHYGCLIDLLGRSGQLLKALTIILEMQIQPDIVVWRSLLSACRKHRNLELGERILDHIAQFDLSKQGGGHLLLLNLYASAGRWEEVAELRGRISVESDVSMTGWSYTEVKGEGHEFTADDLLHHRISETHSS